LEWDVNAGKRQAFDAAYMAKIIILKDVRDYSSVMEPENGSDSVTARL
jgi:hypothetical protein